MNQPTFVPSSVKPPEFINGHHPNSILFLDPCNYWDIWIDETGQHHNSQAIAELNINDVEVGKYIALAVPKTIKDLPKLEYGFHAVDVSHQRKDKIFQDLLDRRVGIFGLNAKDKTLKNNTGWFNAILNLIRIVLRLLPFDAADMDNRRVRIFIEQYDKYAATIIDKTNDKDDVVSKEKMLAEILKAELAAIAPARFARVGLEIRFVGKSDPGPKDYRDYNGYVDTLANTWYNTRSDRLNQSKLKEHCLLNAQGSTAIERLYLGLNSQAPLQPGHWYRFMQEAQPQSSLIYEVLTHLGYEVQKDVKLWQTYLDEVTVQLQRKNYRPAQLKRAFDWLDQYRPAQGKFSPQQQLQYYSAQLASHNHRGHFEYELIQKIFEVVNSHQLLEEIAPEICQTYLRIVVAGSNVFEFRESLPLLEWLLEQDQGSNGAIYGRSNYSKLLSQYGQQLAFSGELEQAHQYFKRSMQVWDKLSDLEQKQKETSQTNTYRLLNMLDRNNQTAATMQRELEKHFGKNNQPLPLDKIIVQLASDSKQPYAQNLLLRTLVAYPDELTEYRQQYLDLAEQWQHECNHPWNLIEFWRGWLLLQQDSHALDKAQQQFCLAIQQHEGDSITLQWIVVVLATVAKKLDTNLGTYFLNEQYQHLQQCLPQAPHAAYKALQAEQSKNLDILYQHVAACLPFNFK